MRYLVIDALRIPLFRSPGHDVTGSFDAEGLFSLRAPVTSPDGTALLAQYEAWAAQEGLLVIDRHAQPPPAPMSAFLLQLHRADLSVGIGFSGPLPAQPYSQLLVSLARA